MNKTIESLEQSLYDLGTNLFEHPELGYKENKTKEILVQFFKNHKVQVHKEYTITGFSVQCGQGSPHIALIAEMDAVITAQHRCATNNDFAAHSCGHSSQCVMMSAVFLALKQSITKGTITLFFTPAEEYIDIEYRNQLLADGKIRAIGGKQEMLLNHEFEGIDCFIHAHGMGEAKELYSIHSQLAGFNFQKYTFLGQTAHAAVMPDQAKNALNMFSLFNSAVAYLRETFIDEDKNRFHGHLLPSNHSINSIPDKIEYEAYVRSFNSNKLKSLSEQFALTAQHCAAALGGKCEVKTTLGYLPLKPSIELGELFNEEILKVCPSQLIRYHERSIAAGDIGDLSQFYPGIQLGYSGFKGRMHGDDLEISDPHFIYCEVSSIIVQVVERLILEEKWFESIENNFDKKLDFDTYKLRFGE